MIANPHFPKLFEPIRVGNLTIKNRIVMSAMGGNYRSATGEPTERTLQKYMQVARGEVGLIVVTSLGLMGRETSTAGTTITISPSMAGGRQEDPSIDRDYVLVELLHSYGATVAVQIGHSGRQSRSNPEAPSPLRCVLLGEDAFPIPRELSRDEIYDIMDLLADKAARARRAGYDLVELHGCHGYLDTNFMSPYMNKRTDEFGGSLENRMRFSLEVVKRIQERAGKDFPISFRFNADDFVEGGITTKESPIIAQMLQDAGVALLNVSSGIYETLHLSNDIMSLAEGWKLYMWEAIKKVAKVPIVAGGSLKTPEYCDWLIAQGKADMVGLARAFLADPEWAKKAKEGRSEDICKCVSCLECNAFPYGGRSSWKCAVNPFMGRPLDYAEANTPATVKKRVMVVGGGPAGMEAAMIAAKRGHEVALYEKKTELGGQIRLAATPPGKDKIFWMRDYLTTQMRKLGIKVVLGTEATPELVRQQSPDVLIVATGAEPWIPDNIPGVQNGNVLTAWQVLDGGPEIRDKKVAVIGGFMVGSETADFLSERGNQVTIVMRSSHPAPDMQPANRKGLMERLQTKKVTILTEHETEAINHQGVVVSSKGDGSKRLLEVDWVVLARGATPVRSLADALEGQVPELYVIGDAQEPRRFVEATYEGALVGRRI